MEKQNGGNIYDAIGVKHYINCSGQLTLLGASSMSPRVWGVMEQANGRYAAIHELMDRAAEIIAETLGAEAASITTGTTGGLIFSVAACMCGTDTDKIERIPDTSGMKNEFIVQRPERWNFERVVTQTGGKVVQAGGETRCTSEELEAAIGGKTAAIIWIAGSKLRNPHEASVPLEETARIGKKHNVPVILDAAGVAYPLERMRDYAQGADLVCFGAKYIGGPNSAGYVCGRKELIEAVEKQGFIAWMEYILQGRKGGIGRASKVDSLEVVACVVSLQEWFEMDHGARLSESERKPRVIKGEVDGIRGVATSIAACQHGDPVLRIVLDAQAVGKSGRDVALELAQGDPQIWMVWIPRLRDEMYVSAAWRCLMDGEELIAARRLSDVLTGSGRVTNEIIAHPAFLDLERERLAS